jgi:starch phosphorylase
MCQGDRAIRLAQYAVLGIGGVRALRAMGITPGVYHLNEGHPALGVFELLAQTKADFKALHQTELPGEDAWHQVRAQVVFTTHTPVPTSQPRGHRWPTYRQPNCGGHAALRDVRW